ncbi:MAG: PIN domain-containing protein, partial [Nitrospirae bacterium]
LIYTTAKKKILIGKDVTKGLGAGSQPRLGEEAAKESEHEIKKALEGIHVFSLTEDITSIAISLIEKYSKGYGLKIPDALIASTCLSHKIPLFTYNRKDFVFIEDLKLLNPEGGMP